MEDSVISVVIPVYRESDRINRLIDHLRRLDPDHRCEIIVVDGEPRCGTLAVIRDKRVVTLRSEKGRARQMNAGATVARGRTLLFLHADTYLPSDGIALILSAMADPRYVGGAFGFSIDSERRVLRCVSALVSIRSRLTRLPLGDHGIFIRTEYFFRIGGYRDFPIMEDLELMRRIKLRGDRITVLRPRVTTSARRIEREGLLYCTFRNISLMWLYSLGASPERLKRYYPDSPVRPGWTGGLPRERDA